jgi:signal transduction histidine kinase
MAEKAMELASDPGFVRALEDGMDLSEMDLGLSEDYIVMVYDEDGKRLSSTSGEPVPGLDSLEEAGLPPIDEFRPWEPITPREVKVKDKELALSAVMYQSSKSPYPPSQRGNEEVVPFPKGEPWEDDSKGRSSEDDSSGKLWENDSNGGSSEDGSEGGSLEGDSNGRSLGDEPNGESWEDDSEGESSEDDGTITGVVVVGKVIPSAAADIGSETIIAILTLTAAIVFLIALWISSLIARDITNPIQKLVAGTQEVAGGNLDHRVDIDARDEVGMLADSFNQMTIRLHRNAEELRRAEKAAAWREIAQKLAHEIKNPLTPIQLSAERLRRRYNSKREGYEQVLDECTHTIVHEVERLRRLLDEFSRLARMPRANPVPSDVNSILEKAVKLYGEFPENVEVRTESAEDLPQALVDPEQMERAFFNIIKNAIEAMNDGGRLIVSTRATSGSVGVGVPVPSIDSGNKHIEVEFADTGPGISADSMEKLFTPHFSTKRGGAGLGLAIVQKIVTDHGGEVTVKSEEGKGTVFTLRIPAAEGFDTKTTQPKGADSNGRFDHPGSGR